MSALAVQVFCCKTWGQLGNYVAAKRLATLLRSARPNWHVTIHAGEDYVPELGVFGERLRGLTAKPEQTDLAQRYDQLLDGVRSGMPQYAELDRRFLSNNPDIDPLLQWFIRSKPQLIVGVKGIVTRWCIAAINKGGLSIPVLNYLTNPGLLCLDVHRVVGAAGWLLPFDLALAGMGGFVPSGERAEIVGTLLARHLRLDSEHQLAFSPELGRPAVVLLCNRTAPELYLRCLTLALSHPANPKCLFVAPGNSVLVIEAKEILRKMKDVGSLAIDHLQHFDFQDTITAVGGHPHSFLVTKTGPNTMLEACVAGVPLVLHPSSLPMEVWVEDFVRRSGIGKTVVGNQILSLLEQWLDDPQPVRASKSACKKLARIIEHFDPRRTIPVACEKLLPTSGAA
jgi:hypothetical protein